MDGSFGGQLDRHLYIEEFIPKRCPEIAAYLIPAKADPYSWRGLGIDVRVYTVTSTAEHLIANSRKIGCPLSNIISIQCPDYGRVSHVEHWARWDQPGWITKCSNSAIPMMGLPKWPDLVRFVREWEQANAIQR